MEACGVCREWATPTRRNKEWATIGRKSWLLRQCLTDGCLEQCVRFNDKSRRIVTRRSRKSAGCVELVARAEFEKRALE